MNRVALVLAAGHSSRFGSDKLLALLDGEPLLVHAIRAARAAPVSRVIVVARPGLDIGTWPAAPVVDAVRVESEALSQSLKAGIAAARGASGVFVFLGDMPRVPHGQAGRLAARMGGHAAALPRYRGCPGHPALIGASLFPEIAALTGDEGAGRLLRSRDDVAFDDVEDASVTQDVDRPEDLRALRGTTS